MESIIYILSETVKQEGNKKVSILRRTHNRYAVFIAFATVILILSLPFVEQTHIHVEIKQNEIIDVWVETPQVSLISTIFPQSEGVGINTIVITISPTGEVFQFNDVPSGEYTEVWISDGLPESGNYVINVQLIQGGNLIDVFTFGVSF